MHLFYLALKRNEAVCGLNACDTPDLDSFSLDQVFSFLFSSKDYLTILDHPFSPPRNQLR